MDAASPFRASDETWERLLALNETELAASIRACSLYLASPEGVAEFGDLLGRCESVEKLEKAK